MTSRYSASNAFIVLGGAIPILLGSSLYKLFLIAYYQLVFWRWASLVVTVALCVLALSGAIVMGASCVTPLLDRLRLRRLLHACLLVGFCFNFVYIAAAMFQEFFDRAPHRMWIALALSLVILSKSYVDQRFIARFICRLGLGTYLVPLVLVPGVIWANMEDEMTPLNPLTTSLGAVKPDAPRRIVLVTFDAWRGVSTTMERPGLDLSPCMAALARKSTYFSNWHASGDQTIAAMPTLLSGVRLKRMRPYMSEKAGYVRTGALHGLGAYLRAAGSATFYETNLLGPASMGLRGDFDDGHASNLIYGRAIFNTPSFVPWKALLDPRAWHSFTLTRRGDLPDTDSLTATCRTFDSVRTRLRAAPRPTFVWLHMGVPHFPYYRVPRTHRGKGLARKKYPVVPAQAPSTAGLAQIWHYEGLYEDTVRLADAELGRFLDGLVRDGLWNETMLIVMSDHGETFVPGAVGHGTGWLSEDICRVPCILHVPGQRIGRKDPVLATHLDLVPTVLSAVYTRQPVGFEGASLLGAQPASDRMIVASTAHFPQVRSLPNSIAVYQGKFKYIMHWPIVREALFDLSSDPQESVDIQAQYPLVFARLAKRCRQEL